MNERADYVNIDPTTRERWSTFDEYQPVIAMLYLAAIDSNTPAIDGHTHEGRVDHFINELAQIGRAHNWDHTRTNAQGIQEEYDDLTGDKPSCYSGVKRRLFQSVVGHPLMTILSKDMIAQELKGFVHAHFKEVIHDSNREALNAAMEKIIEGDPLEKKDIDALKACDISQQKIGQFISALNQKYGDQFTADPSLVADIQKTLSLKEGVVEESENSHLGQLYGFANLGVLLEKPAQTATPSRIGMFSAKPKAEPPKPDRSPDHPGPPKGV
jgi:hypothetical protein